MSSYLSDRAFKIRAKQIPWEGYQRAGLLSVQDVALIQRVSPKALESEPEVYASLYVRLLNKLSRNDTLQLLLVLIHDMLIENEDRIALFLNLPDSPYPALIKLLDSPDDFVRLKSTVVLSTFVAANVSSTALNAVEGGEDALIHKLVSHLGSLLNNAEDTEGQVIAVESLEQVLALEKIRSFVWQAQSTTSAKDGPAGKVIEGLVSLLKGSPSSQTQYELTFCFWLLSFDAKVAAGLNSKYAVVPLLVEVARDASKEKVVRIAIAALRNLIVNAPSANLPAMLTAKLQPLVQSLSERKFSDEEIKEDLDWIAGELKTNFQGLTTYDVYTSELESGQLSWSPVHNSEDFWRENASKLNDKNKLVLQRLIEILKSATDAVILAVAASDVAHYIKYCDTGKKAVEELQARGRIMELMGHADADVKYHALVCVQRLISQPWA